MLELKISKKFAKIKDFSINLKYGSKVAICGKNGSGKTTILRIIAGLVKPDSGFVKLNGRISFYIQNSGFYGFLKVRDIAHIYSIKENVLADFVEKEIWKLRFEELSSGYRKRLTLSYLFSNEAELYLIDEPFEGIDEYTSGLIKSYIDKIDAAFILTSLKPVDGFDAIPI